MGIFDFFTKRNKETFEEKRIRITNEGVNGMFSFLDEVLPDYNDEDFANITPQIFLVLYIVGMTKTWSRLNQVDYLRELGMTLAVTDGLYYRYGIEFRDWVNFLPYLYDDDKINDTYSYDFVRKGVKLGEDHFFYYCTLKVIPHNPLDIYLQKWSEIQFYNEDHPVSKGEILGEFSKKEYSFISDIMMYELPDIEAIQKSWNSIYEKFLEHTSEKYPFDKEKFIII